uniref:Major sperm protein n=1 Tax=Rhabditophanes sp. KR3021 TaxID=114890 RepID=A0AC35UDP6_9BILA
MEFVSTSIQLLLLLCGVLTFSILGCSDKKEKNKTSKKSKSSSQKQVQPTVTKATDTCGAQDVRKIPSDALSNYENELVGKICKATPSVTTAKVPSKTKIGENSNKSHTSSTHSKTKKTSAMGPDAELLHKLQNWKCSNHHQILATMSPTELRWDMGSGGMRSLNLENPSQHRLAVKIKCSDNLMYRVNPVFTIVEPETKISIDVLREAGQESTDKIVIVLSKMDDKTRNAKDHFDTPNIRSQMLVLPLIGTSPIY